MLFFKKRFEFFPFKEISNNVDFLIFKALCVVAHFVEITFTVSWNRERVREKQKTA